MRGALTGACHDRHGAVRRIAGCTVALVDPCRSRPVPSADGPAPRLPARQRAYFHGGPQHAQRRLCRRRHPRCCHDGEELRRAPGQRPLVVELLSHRVGVCRSGLQRCSLIPWPARCSRRCTDGGRGRRRGRPRSPPSCSFFLFSFFFPLRRPSPCAALVCPCVKWTVECIYSASNVTNTGTRSGADLPTRWPAWWRGH